MNRFIQRASLFFKNINWNAVMGTCSILAITISTYQFYRSVSISEKSIRIENNHFLLLNRPIPSIDARTVWHAQELNYEFGIENMGSLTMLIDSLVILHMDSSMAYAVRHRLIGANEIIPSHAKTLIKVQALGLNVEAMTKPAIVVIVLYVNIPGLDYPQRFLTTFLWDRQPTETMLNLAMKRSDSRVLAFIENPATTIDVFSIAGTFVVHRLPDTNQ